MRRYHSLSLTSALDALRGICEPNSCFSRVSLTPHPLPQKQKPPYWAVSLYNMGYSQSEDFSSRLVRVNSRRLCLKCEPGSCVARAASTPHPLPQKQKPPNRAVSLYNMGYSQSEDFSSRLVRVNSRRLCLKCEPNSCVARVASSPHPLPQKQKPPYWAVSLLWRREWDSNP